MTEAIEFQPSTALRKGSDPSGGVFDPARTLRVDERFLDDMRLSCARRRAALVRAQCRRWALLFYAAVCRFG